MASEMGLAFMFLIQTGLALLTVLGACFCIVSHFFFQPTPVSHHLKYQNSDWGSLSVPLPPRADHRKPASTESPTETLRFRRGGISEKEAVSLRSCFSHWILVLNSAMTISGG